MKGKGVGTVDRIWATEGILSKRDDGPTDFAHHITSTQVSIIGRELARPEYPNDLTELYRPGDLVKFTAQKSGRRQWIAEEIAIIEQAPDELPVLTGQLSRLVPNRAIGFINAKDPSGRVIEVFFQGRAFVTPPHATMHDSMYDLMAPGTRVTFRLFVHNRVSRGQTPYEAVSVSMIDASNIARPQFLISGLKVQTAAPVPSNIPAEGLTLDQYNMPVTGSSVAPLPRHGNPTMQNSIPTNSAPAGSSHSAGEPSPVDKDIIQQQALKALSICLESRDIDPSEMRRLYLECPLIVNFAAQTGALSPGGNTGPTSAI